MIRAAHKFLTMSRLRSLYVWHPISAAAEDLIILLTCKDFNLTYIVRCHSLDMLFTTTCLCKYPFLLQNWQVALNIGQCFFVCKEPPQKKTLFIWWSSCNSLLLWFLLTLDIIQIRVSKATWTNFNHFLN